ARAPHGAIEAGIAGHLETRLRGGVAVRLRAAAPDVIRREGGVAAEVRGFAARGRQCKCERAQGQEIPCHLFRSFRHRMARLATTKLSKGGASNLHSPATAKA